jgi:hypothetical protein
VLIVVVEQNAAQWREPLSRVHEDLFGPGKSDPLAPTQLEVIDRTTDEAIQRLVAAGLIAKVTRATRPLFPDGGAGDQAPPLSEEEKARAAGHRGLAQRKLKMARVLLDGEFPDEARASALQAAEALGNALAIEQRMPEPGKLESALLPPLSQAWRDGLPIVRAFVSDAQHPCEPVLSALGKL